MRILLKRAYEKPARADGYRVLVDRLWPRGVKKTDLHLDAWAKDIAPSTALRQWFGHDPERWQGFRERYERELEDSATRDTIAATIESANRSAAITLVYGAKDTIHNEAVVLQEIFERVASSQSSAPKEPTKRSKAATTSA